MPPRKSNTSANGEENGDRFGVEDLSLPRTMIQRLAKGVLPANTQVQKDALLALSKSATVFVNYLSSHAAENATRNNKKTIQPKDVFDALHDLEFDDFFPRVQMELDKYNTVQCDKRNTYRRKVREEQLSKKVDTARDVLGGAEGSQEEEVDGIDGRFEPAAKKMRRSSVDGGEAMAVDEDGDEDDEGDEQEGDDEEEEEDEEDEDVEHDEVDDEEEDDEDPNTQLVDREDDEDDSLKAHTNDGIGDEALDGDDSD